MKTLITLCITLLISTLSLAQIANCDCKTDLDFLVGKMKDMPSYKHQIEKANRENEFQLTYDSLAGKMSSPISKADCFQYLNEMMATVNDLHAAVRDVSEGLSKEDLKDEAILSKFLSSETFKNHPTSSKDLQALKLELSDKPFKDIEGIYQFSTYQTIGVYRTDDKSVLEAVVLESNVPNWVPGQILLTLKDQGDSRYDITRYDITSRKLQHVKSLYTSNGRIWNLRKDMEAIDYVIAPSENSNWEFKQLNDSTQYLYFGSFSNTNKTKEAFKTFFSEVKGKIGAENIIVDLRNNGGGNKKYSDPFIKYLRKSKANVYIITNTFTGSNAEQFTVKLMALPNGTHIGQRTRGALAYGRNYGYRYDTPSGLFQVIPTDMDFHNKYIQFERTGIVPEIELDFKTDWIQQTLTIINTKIQ